MKNKQQQPSTVENAAPQYSCSSVATATVEDVAEATPVVGKMVALRLHKYEADLPQIGKVVKLTEFDVTVKWWIGTYYSTWIEWKERGKVIQETFPRNAILSNNVHFTKAFRLTQASINALKHAYTQKELI